jgi:hypothetical protein
MNADERDRAQIDVLAELERLAKLFEEHERLIEANMTRQLTKRLQNEVLIEDTSVEIAS